MAANFGLQSIIGDIYFYQQFIKNYLKNRNFKKQHPTIVIPPDRKLFETFQLNYAQYFNDGELAAKELSHIYQSYSNKVDPYILDWGCGTGRITRFIPTILPNSTCYGADISASCIHWNRKHLQSIYFDIIEDNQLPYPSSLFDFVLGISVLTHIPGEVQYSWLKELHRISKPNAIMLISTHGEAFSHQLFANETNQLNKEGYYTQYYKESGNRLMTTYNNASHLKETIESLFTVIAYYNGKSHPDKLGGQDLWILQKQ